MSHWFEYDLKEWDRTLKKADYKAIKRWFRQARNKVEPMVELKMREQIASLLINGYYVEGLPS